MKRPGVEALLAGNLAFWSAALALHQVFLPYSFPRLALTPDRDAEYRVALGLAMLAGYLAVRLPMGQRQLDQILAGSLLLGVAAMLALHVRPHTWLRWLILWSGLSCGATAWLARTVRPARYHAAILGLLAAMALVHLPLLAGECALRWRMGSDHPPCLSYSNTLWKMARLYDRECNSVGLRDYEYPDFNPPGSTRILALGDSVTFGLGVAMEETLPKRLEAALEEDPPFGSRFEVINAGWPGQSLAGDFDTLRTRGVLYDPELVLLVLFPNDTEGVGNPGYPIGLNRYLDPLYESWLAWSYLQQAGSRAAAQAGLRQPYLEWLAGTYRGEGMAAFDLALGRTHLWCRSREKTLAVVLFPFLEDLDAYPLQEAHEAVRAAAERRGIPFLDLLAAFAGRDARSLQLDPAFDHHPNAEAYRLGAEAIEPWLRELLRSSVQR